mmetsp:Transcript_20734/g.30846  ORF Transcript_20734/g.30846 Transcript_20734/m.30846 type:complete len:95 (+) Transcript_20734:77-361(+)
MRAYLAQRGYTLEPVSVNKQHLIDAVGDQITSVEATDLTKRWIELLKKELARLEEVKSSLTEKDYKDLKTGWEQKIVRAQAGQQGWASYYAVKK